MYYLYKIINREKHYFTGTSLSNEFKQAKLYNSKVPLLRDNKKWLKGFGTMGLIKKDN